jgi:adenylate cyclase
MTRSFAAACFAAAIAALVISTPLGRSIEQEFGQYLLIRLRGPVTVPPDVVIVAQDYSSAATLALPHKLSGWPRRHLARVIEQASAAHARVIAVDLFLEVPQNESDDAALERAIAASGRVTVVERMTRHPSGTAHPAFRIIDEQAIRALPRFAEAAQATAPFPLPRGWWRTAAFWTFKAGAEGRATLPAATMLMAAFVDPAVRTTLADSAVRARLPDIADLIAHPGLSFEFRIDRLRRLLAANPALAERMVRLVADAHDPAIARLATATLRLLAGPTTRLLVPYGPAGYVPRVSYHRVVAGEPDALAMLRGKIVFVGASDLLNQAEVDTFATVFTHRDGIEMGGVEVAATAYLNLLHGDAAVPASWTVGLPLVGASAASAALVATALPPLVSSAAVIIVAIATAAIGTVALQAWQTALPLGTLLLVALPAGWLTGRLSQHRIVRRQLDRAVALLSRGHVQRADPLLAVERAIGRQERWAVCLATDLADYVRLTEHMRSHETALADLLTAYRTIVEGVIEHHGGTVLNFVADSSMCLWEAEKPSARLRLAAAGAATELVERLDAFAAAHGLDAHRTRVGLADGWIVLGNLAGDGHFSFGAVGEPLNIASRLEQLNKLLGTQILATAAVARDLTNVPVEVLGTMPLKGKSMPEQIVALRRRGGCPAYKESHSRLAHSVF